MIRKIALYFVLLGLAGASGGCVAIMAAGAAGSTVVWQGGKIISEEKVPRDRAVDAALAVFKQKEIRLTEKVTKTKATQLRGAYPDGANVYVDVLPVGPQNCRIEVRVGMGQKRPARELLDEIKNRL